MPAATKTKDKPAKAAKATKPAAKTPTTKPTPAAKAATPKAAPKPKPVNLRKVTMTGQRYEKQRKAVIEMRDKLDAEILVAKQAGASYREIAEAAGLSVSWVQTSLGRSGYQGVSGRVRANSNSNAA